MVLNPDKCFFMLFAVKDKLQIDLLSKNVTVKNSKDEEKQKTTLKKTNS